MTNVCVVQNYSRRPCIFNKCLRCLLLSPLMLMIIRAGRSDRLLPLSRSRTRATCSARTHTQLCTHTHTYVHICMFPPKKLRHIDTHVVQTHAANTVTLAVSVQLLLILFFACPLSFSVLNIAFDSDSFFRKHMQTNGEAGLPGPRLAVRTPSPTPISDTFSIFAPSSFFSLTLCFVCVCVCVCAGSTH